MNKWISACVENATPICFAWYHIVALADRFSHRRVDLEQPLAGELAKERRRGDTIYLEIELRGLDLSYV